MIVDCALYRHGVRADPAELHCGPTDFAELLAGADEPGDFVWVGLNTPTQEEMDRAQQAFDLHPLAVEDALKAHQRPKLERYGDVIFLTVKTLWYVDAQDAVETGEINMFIGERFVVTVRHGGGPGLTSTRNLLESRESVLTHGPSAVAYGVCDAVVDEYVSVVNSLVEDVDEIETSVFSTDRTNDANRIYILKREIAEVRRAVLPLREPMRRFASGTVEGIEPGSQPFFRDVADHLAQVSDTIDQLDSLLSTAFDAHLAQLSLRQNDDMRKISAYVALAAVPTLVAGIYGMNFDDMPELHWAFGYPYSLLLMGSVVTGLWIFFKRSGWL